MKHTKFASVLLMIIIAASLIVSMSATVFAADGAAEGAETQESVEAVDNSTGTKAMAAAIVVGVVAAVGAISMGWAIAKSSDAVARQPEAADKVRSGMMLGLVFIETAIIYALIIAILIIFVL